LPDEGFLNRNEEMKHAKFYAAFYQFNNQHYR